MIKQNRKDGCGEACFRNALALFYKKKSAGYALCPNQCANMKEIQISLASYGIHGEGFAVEKPEVLKKIKGPFILLFQKEGEEGHFVLVSSFRCGHFLVKDPAVGGQLLSFRKLLEKGPQAILTLTKKEETSLPCFQLIRPVERFISFFLALLLGTCVLTGLVLLGLKDISG